MAEEKKAAKKAEILNELQSIRGLLDEDLTVDEDMVPTLQEIVALEQDDIAPELISQIYRENLGDQEAASGTEETSQKNSARPSGPQDPLPGQQSLFGETQANKTSQKSQTTSAKPTQATAKPLGEDENPFLPKHIRDRLQGNKPHLGMQSFVPSDENLKSLRSTQHQAIIDDLIADYLPKIEIALRQRLEKVLKADEPATERPVDP